MPQFRWSAIDGGGNVVGGLMEAADAAVVVERLQRQGQIVLRADPTDRRNRLSELLRLDLAGSRGLKKTTLCKVTPELAIMLASRRDLAPTMRLFADSTRIALPQSIIGTIPD